MFSSSLKILLAILCTITVIVNSQTRTCGGDCRCARRTSCRLRCRGEDQCKDSTLRCRNDNNLCIVDCRGKAACAGNSIIEADGATTFEARCRGEDACKDAEIDCDDAGTECEVTCEGKSSCGGDQNINAGDADSLTILCDDEDACKDRTIICPDSEAAESCDVTCNGEKSCENVQVINGDACTCSDAGTGGCDGLSGCAEVSFALKADGRMIGEEDHDGVDLFNNRFTDKHNGGAGQVTLNMSKNTIINLWSMALLFVIINIGIYVWMNKNKDLNKVQQKYIEE